MKTFSADKIIPVFEEYLSYARLVSVDAKGKWHAMLPDLIDELQAITNALRRMKKYSRKDSIFLESNLVLCKAITMLGVRGFNNG
jgi:hypothetical protein